MVDGDWCVSAVSDRRILILIVQSTHCSLRSLLWYLWAVVLFDCMGSLLAISRVLVLLLCKCFLL